MSVHYDFLPLPSKENDGNAPRFYPKLLPYQTIKFKTLVEKYDWFVEKQGVAGFKQVGKSPPY